MKKLGLGLLAWMAAISGLHGWLNVDWSSVINDYLPASQRRLNVAYIPVT